MDFDQAFKSFELKTSEGASHKQVSNRGLGHAAHQAIGAEMFVQPFHARSQVDVLAKGSVIHALFTSEVPYVRLAGMQADAGRQQTSLNRLGGLLTE